MRKTTCSNCEQPLSQNRIESRQRYCNPCHAEWMRMYRPKHSELNPEQRKKANARSYANTYEKRGLIRLEPCVICGNDNAEKHHHDYSKPTDVQWLCRPCHIEIHKMSTGDIIEPIRVQKKAA